MSEQGHSPRLKCTQAGANLTLPNELLDHAAELQQHPRPGVRASLAPLARGGLLCRPRSSHLGRRRRDRPIRRTPFRRRLELGGEARDLPGPRRGRVHGSGAGRGRRRSGPGLLPRGRPPRAVRTGARGGQRVGRPPPVEHRVPVVALHPPPRRPGVGRGGRAGGGPDRHSRVGRVGVLPPSEEGTPFLPGPPVGRAPGRRRQRRGSAGRRLGPVLGTGDGIARRNPRGGRRHARDGGFRGRHCSVFRGFFASYPSRGGRAVPSKAPPLLRSLGLRPPTFFLLGCLWSVQSKGDRRDGCCLPPAPAWSRRSFRADRRSDQRARAAGPVKTKSADVRVLVCARAAINIRSTCYRRRRDPCRNFAALSSVFFGTGCPLPPLSYTTNEAQGVGLCHCR